MGQGIHILGDVHRLVHGIPMSILNNRYCGSFFRADGDEKEYKRRLKDIHTHKLFHQIALCYHGIKAYHHKDYINPVIKLAYDKIHYCCASSCSPPEARLRNIETMTAITVIPTPISTPNVPRALAFAGLTENILFSIP